MTARAPRTAITSAFGFAVASCALGVSTDSYDTSSETALYHVSGTIDGLEGGARHARPQRRDGDDVLPANTWADDVFMR